MVRDRSATPCGLTWALDWSSSLGSLFAGVELGSGKSDAVTWAVLVIGSSTSTVAVTVRVSTSPLAMSPTLQSPEVGS